jgi:hypothetical protein
VAVVAVAVHPHIRLALLAVLAVVLAQILAHLVALQHLGKVMLVVLPLVVVLRIPQAVVAVLVQ